MQKRIDKKNKIIYMPPSVDDDVYINWTKGQLTIDEKYRYKRNIFYRFFQFFAYYLIGIPVFFIYDKVILGVKIIGKEKLKKIKGGAVTVSNHVHFVDFTIPTTFISKLKRTYVISNKENFQIPIAKHFIKAYGAIPLPDSPKANVNFYKLIEGYLKKGNYVHIFPEKSMWPYYTKLRPFKSGAFHFAVKGNVPVIPYVMTFRESKGLSKLFRKKPKLTITICEPLYADKNLPIKEQVADLCNRTQIEMQKIIENTPNCEYFKYIK